MKYGILTTDTATNSKGLSQYIYNKLSNAEKHVNKFNNTYVLGFSNIKFEVVELPDKFYIDD